MFNLKLFRFTKLDSKYDLLWMNTFIMYDRLVLLQCGWFLLVLVWTNCWHWPTQPNSDPKFSTSCVHLSWSGMLQENELFQNANIFWCKNAGLIPFWKLYFLGEVFSCSWQPSLLIWKSFSCQKIFPYLSNNLSCGINFLFGMCVPFGISGKPQWPLLTAFYLQNFWELVSDFVCLYSWWHLINWSCVVY